MASQAVLELLVNLKDNASGGLSSIGGALKGLGTIGLGVAAGGIAAVGAALVSGIGDARAHAQVMAQTEQVIKTMGDSAGVSAQHVEDFAASLSAASGKSLFGDDEIQAATNMLLTFGNIKGEMLDLATTLTVDMAQAFKSTPEQMSIMIGKLLNSADAMSAAKRMGVSFTEEQMKLGKELFETGRIGEYQALVMGELNKEFGGQAEAAAKADGGWAQFKDRMGEAAETIGGLLLPILNQAVAFLNDSVMPVIEDMAGAFTEAGDFTLGLGAAINTLLNEVFGLNTNIGFLVTDGIDVLLAAIQEVGPIIETMIGLFAGGGLSGALAQTGVDFEALATTVQGVMDGIMAVVGAVLAQVSAFWAAHGAEITAFAQQAWNEIASIINVAIELINATVVPALQGIAKFIGEHSAEIQAIFSGTWNTIKGVIDIALALIGGILRTALAVVKGDWQGAWDEVKTTATRIWNDIKGIIDTQINTIKSVLGGAWEEIKRAAEGAWNDLKSTIETTKNNIVSTLEELPGMMVAIGGDIIQGIIDGAQAAAGQLFSFFRGLAEDALQAARDALGISSPSKAFAEIGENSMIGLLQGLQGMLPDMLEGLQVISTQMLLRVGEITEQLKGKMSDAARKALEDERAMLEKQIDTIEKTMGRLPDLVHEALADAFDASATIDRTAAKNIDAVSRLAQNLQGATTQALAEAKQAAAQIADPEEAAKFFKLRSSQILELAKMQSDIQEANEKGDFQRASDLRQQIDLIKSAQAAERASMDERMQMTNNSSLGAIAKQLGELFGPNGITIGGNMPPEIMQLYDLLTRINAAAQGRTLPGQALPPGATPPSGPAPGGPVMLPTPAPLNIQAGAIVVNAALGQNAQQIAQLVMDEISRRSGGRF